MDKMLDNSGPAALTSATSTFILFGLNAEEVAVLTSAAIAVATFCVYLWHTINKERRAEEAHRRFMQGNVNAGQKDDTL